MLMNVALRQSRKLGSLLSEMSMNFAAPAAAGFATLSRLRHKGGEDQRRRSGPATTVTTSSGTSAAPGGEGKEAEAKLKTNLRSRGKRTPK